MSRGPLPRHADLEFVPSLRLLVEREQYSLTDIGMMFGVSRERVRQWVERYGIDRPNGKLVGLHCIRRWDDTLNRFIPISRGDLSAYQRRARGFAHRERAATERARKWERAVVAIIARREQLGRDLTTREMAEAVVGRPLPRNGGQGFLQVLDRRRSFARAVRALCEATGMQLRPIGTPGHLDPTALRKTHCKRGHAMAGDNLYWYKGKRQCRACRNIRKEKSLAKQVQLGPHRRPHPQSR